MFSYRDGQLFGEGVALADVAQEVGTPVYVYSQAVLMAQATAYLEAARTHLSRFLVCYALKANGNLALLRLLAGLGLGADVTSGGELFLALQAGIDPHKIIFSGVGKTRREIEEALAAGILALHIESAMELAAVGQIATEMGRVAAIGLRLNPNIPAGTHPHISTGRDEHKFGLAPAQARTLWQQAANHPWLQPIGLAAHIGSQITSLTPFLQTGQFLAEFAAQFAGQGVELDYLDMGGGLAIPYQNEQPPTPAGLLAALAPVIGNYRLVLEPGRFVVGPAGALLTAVVYHKAQGGKQFVITDAGMNDLLRPALYGAHHPIWPAAEKPAAQKADVVGPICETADYLGQGRDLPLLRPGDLLAVMQAGAYGFAMSSNYNGRLRPAEVLISGSNFQLIRPRQSYHDLL